MSLDDDAICGRCLVVVNATTSIVAIWSNGTSHPPNPYDPPLLKAWAEEMIYVNRARVRTNDAPGTFHAVTTWHGDPVCPVHLHELRQREVTGDRPAR